MAKHYRLSDGEWIRPKRRGFKEQCCDCGLVHTWDFRVTDNAIEFRVHRNERATAAARRGIRKKVIIIDN